MHTLRRRRIRAGGCAGRAGFGLEQFRGSVVGDVVAADLVLPLLQQRAVEKLEKLLRAGYNAGFTSLEDGVRRYVTAFLDTADRYR